MDKQRVMKFWLCNGKACPAGTPNCAVQDPENWPDGCRHTTIKDFARILNNPHPFKLGAYKNTLYLVEREEE